MKKGNLLSSAFGLLALGATVFVIGYAFKKGAKAGSK